jgi:hypothetical protein
MDARDQRRWVSRTKYEVRKNLLKSRVPSLPREAGRADRIVNTVYASAGTPRTYYSRKENAVECMAKDAKSKTRIVVSMVEGQMTSMDCNPEVRCCSPGAREKACCPQL